MNLIAEVANMWEEIKTPDGKLLYRINYIDCLIESAKGIWIVTLNYMTREEVARRRAQ